MDAAQAKFDDAGSAGAGGAKGAAPDALCSLRGVTRSFATQDGTVEVLRGVDLEVRPGDCLRIRGPSGAGKTTLLSILGLLDTGYGGSYLFEGNEARAAPESTRSAWRLRDVGFAFQDLHLVPSLTSAENLAVVAMAKGASDADAGARATQLLSTSGLGDRLQHRPGALSGGERRRVALGRALMNQPRLLLLDEPTSGLDEASAEGVASLVQEAAAAGTAVVAASHDARFPGPGFRNLHLADGRLSM